MSAVHRLFSVCISEEGVLVAKDLGHKASSLFFFNAKTAALAAPGKEEALRRKYSKQMLPDLLDWRIRDLLRSVTI